MVEPLGDITLKSGERVQAVAIRGPDEDWRPQIARLLRHKGDPWVWQNTELLTHATGVDAWFYVLHRAGIPFSHIMTAAVGGVGIFGHVWTEPVDRAQGASGQLMERQMNHFRARGGRALYLNTQSGLRPLSTARLRPDRAAERGDDLHRREQREIRSELFCTGHREN